MRAQERLLQRLLAVLAVAEHVAAEREQRGVVAVVEGLEGGSVAAPHEGREARVVLPIEPTVGAELGTSAPGERPHPEPIPHERPTCPRGQGSSRASPPRPKGARHVQKSGSPFLAVLAAAAVASAPRGRGPLRPALRHRRRRRHPLPDAASTAARSRSTVIRAASSSTSRGTGPSPARCGRWCSCSTAAPAPASSSCASPAGASRPTRPASSPSSRPACATACSTAAAGRRSGTTFDLADEVDLDEKPARLPEDAPWPADDVGFAGSIMRDLGRRLPIDPHRVYASGFSNGGEFAARLAVERSDLARRGRLLRRRRCRRPRRRAGRSRCGSPPARSTTGSSPTPGRRR